MRTTTALALAAAGAVTLAACGAAPIDAGKAAPPPSRSVTAPPSRGSLTAVTLPPAGGSTVTVTGTGTVDGTPDEVTVAIGVQTTAAHATDALAGDNATSAAVQAVLARDGVATADVQTGDVSLYLNYNGAQPNGYQASDTVTATLHDVARAGQVIDDAVAAAGDSGRLDGVTFSIGDTSPLLAAARQRAVAAARDQATQLARAAGLALGALRSVSDQPVQTPGVDYGTALAGTAKAAGAASVPLQPGTQQLSEQITTVWDLVPA